MTSSPETVLVDRESAAGLTRARLDHRLQGSAFTTGPRSDPRLVDPTLAAVVEGAASAAAEAARSAGFARGYREGRDRLEAEFVAALASERAADRARLDQRLAALAHLGTALTAAATALEARAQEPFEQAGAELGSLVADLVEALLGRELAADRALVVDAVRRVAAAAPRNAPLSLRLHPDDVRALRDEGVDLAALVQREVEVYADPAVERGGAVADSGSRHIDAQLTSAVARLREVLAG